MSSTTRHEISFVNGTVQKASIVHFHQSVEHANDDQVRRALNVTEVGPKVITRRRVNEMSRQPNGVAGRVRTGAYVLPLLIPLHRQVLRRTAANRLNPPRMQCRLRFPAGRLIVTSLLSAINTYVASSPRTAAASSTCARHHRFSRQGDQGRQGASTAGTHRSSGGRRQ